MKTLRSFSQNPFGQVLLATLLFCFIFIALFAGLYKAGTAYILKEHSRRAVNLTALTAGAVYANGLELVREANVIIMTAAGIDAAIIALKITTDLALLPAGVAKLITDAENGDPNTRGPFQNTFARIFGVDEAGAFPALIEGQALATANENGLSFSPFFLYNYETGTVADVTVPNMALRFRYADEFLPEDQEATYSLIHNGQRTYFSSDQVEPANNPRNPKQMRVKESSGSTYAGWWVRKETDGSSGDLTGHNPLAKLSAASKIKLIKNYLHQFKLDITDRDDPPCHTFTLLGNVNGKFGNEDKSFYQVGEVRVETYGLAAWDLLNPFQIYLTSVNIGEFPVLREALETLNRIPILNQILQTSDVLNGI
jgi:hypothetical protein